MKKVFTKIAGLSVGLAMAIGVGVAVGGREAARVDAGEIVTYTLQPASGSNNSYAKDCDIEINGITWNLTGNSQQQPWRIGGNSLSGVDRALYSKTVISDDITKIDVTHGTASNITINSWTLIVSKNADFSNPVSTLTPTFAVSSKTTISRPTAVSWAGCYYKFIYNVSVTGTSNKYLQFTKAEFYKESSSTLQSISLSNSSVSGYVSETTFDTAAFQATGIKVTANYSDSSSIDVTSDATVTSATLSVGDNNITVSYGGKTATLVVNAKSQETIDTEAAAAVDALIEEIDFTDDGRTFVDPFNAALTGYRALNANAKSKVTKYNDLSSFMSSNSHYVIFNNALTADSGTKIFDGGNKGTIPESWIIPAGVEFTTGDLVYDGANSAVKLGKSDTEGYITLALTDSGKFFTKIRVAVSKYGTDTGKVNVSGLENTLTPPEESSLVDISSEKLSEITLSTTTKRAYVNYIYFECDKNEDTLDSTIGKTGTLSKTSYVEGESFDPSGLSFSVTYNGGEKQKTITNITWSPDPLTAGTTSVTGTYTEGEQSATINIDGLTVSAYQTKTYGQVGQPLENYAGNYYFYNGVANKIWKPISPADTFSSLDAIATNDTLTSTIMLDEGIVTITAVSGGYTLKNSEGKYIGPKTTGLSSGVVNAEVFEDAVVHQIITVGDDGFVEMTAVYGTETTVYLRFNTASNQLKARYYTDKTKVSGLVLYKSEATPVSTNIELADAFVTDYMHTEISYTDESDTNACRSEGEGALNYYSEAKAAFNLLGEKVRALFVENDRYANPYARLRAWARANGEEFSASNLLVVSQSGRINFMSFAGDNNTMIIVVSIATISTLALTMLLVFKKKKQR